MPKHLAKSLAHCKFLVNNDLYKDYISVIESMISDWELIWMTFWLGPTNKYRLLHCPHFTHSNIPLLSRVHIWLGNSTFALQLFHWLCPIMELHTNFYGSTEEETITSSVTGKFHIGIEPQGIKDRGHSRRQNSKKGTCFRNSEHCHIVNTQEFGENEGKIE